MENTITYVTMVAGFMTLIVGTVTIAWFIRDVRKQNSKVLRRQEALLEKIEEGQRRGFAALLKGIENMHKGIENMHKSMIEGNQKLQKSVEMIARLVTKAERT